MPIDCLVITFPSLAICWRTISAYRWIAPFVERPGLGDDHPSHARHLVGQCNSDFVDMHSLLQRVEPLADVMPAAIKIDLPPGRSLDLM